MKSILSILVMLASSTAFAESKVICKTSGSNTPDFATEEATEAINLEIKKVKNPTFISAPAITTLNTQGHGLGLFNTTICVTLVTPEKK